MNRKRDGLFLMYIQTHYSNISLGKDVCKATLRANLSNGNWIPFLQVQISP